MGTSNPGFNGTPAPAGSTNGVPAQAHDESEWEYEYHDEDTEDVYFTLDLTTHVPNALRAREVSANGRLKPQIIAAPQGQKSAGGFNLSDAGNDDIAQQDAGRVQFLDLHTREPLIRFNGEVHSCYWMTDIGTQFHVSQVGATANPLRPGNVVDVIGITQARLVGKPVTLTSRHDQAGNLRGSTSATAIEVDVDDDDDDDDDNDDDEQDPEDVADLPFADTSSGPGQPLMINRNRLKDPAQEKQASFIERFAAIKQKKGETDVVPVISIRQYELPESKKEEVRRKALQVDGELPPVIGKESTNKRNRRTYAELGRKTKAELQEEKEAKRRRGEEVEEEGRLPSSLTPLRPATRALQNQPPTSENRDQRQTLDPRLEGQQHHGPYYSLQTDDPT